MTAKASPTRIAEASINETNSGRSLSNALVPSDDEMRVIRVARRVATPQISPPSVSVRHCQNRWRAKDSPLDLRDWLAVDHPARWVDDLVEHGLDLSAVYADYTEVRGAPPYDPRLMLKVLIYGYSHGVTSSRALERRCHDDIAFRFTSVMV